MRRYLDTARRYRWFIAIVLALTWGPGAGLAYVEYTTSFEADATIWTERQSQQFAPISPQDPGLTSFMTPAGEQAGVLMQLLQTRSFLQQIVGRTPIRRPQDIDERSFLNEISKRFRVDVLGTNLFRLSYRARDPRTGSEMVLAALALRQDRLAATRTAATAAAATFYRTELGPAQDEALEAQRALDAFDQSHKPPLSPPDEYQQRQLRFLVEETKARVTDMKTRIDRSSALPSIFQLADSLDFQVVDKPLDVVKPSGGTRAAAAIAGGAVAAGLALVGLLLMGGTFLTGGVAGSADIARVAPASLTTVREPIFHRDEKGRWQKRLPTLPEVAGAIGGPDRELRAAHAAARFAPPPTEDAKEREL